MEKTFRNTLLVKAQCYLEGIFNEALILILMMHFPSNSEAKHTFKGIGPLFIFGLCEAVTVDPASKKTFRVTDLSTHSL